MTKQMGLVTSLSGMLICLTVMIITTGGGPHSSSADYSQPSTDGEETAAPLDSTTADTASANPNHTYFGLAGLASENTKDEAEQKPSNKNGLDPESPDRTLFGGSVFKAAQYNPWDIYTPTGRT